MSRSKGFGDTHARGQRRSDVQGIHKNVSRELRSPPKVAETYSVAQTSNLKIYNLFIHHACRSAVLSPEENHRGRVLA